jgi:hypothetical protein
MFCNNCWFKTRKEIKNNPCDLTDLGCNNRVAKHSVISPEHLHSYKAKSLLLGKEHRSSIKVNIYDDEGNRKSSFSMGIDFEDEHNFYIHEGLDSFSIKKDDLKFSQNGKSIWCAYLK